MIGLFSFELVYKAIAAFKAAIDANGFLSSSDPDADAVITAIESNGGTLTTPQEDAIKTLISAAKTNGLWTNRYAHYGMAGGTAGSNSINWKNPGTNDIVWNGPAMTHNSSGVTGINNTLSYGDTGFSPDDLPQDSVSACAYVVAKSIPVLSNYIFGCETGGDRFSMWRNNPSPDEFRAYINDSDRIENSNEDPGYISITRNNSASRNVSAEGNVLADTAASTGKATDNFYILSRNNDGVSDRTSLDTIGVVTFFSTSLTSEQDEANRAAEEAYQAAMGR